MSVTLLAPITIPQLPPATLPVSAANLVVLAQNGVATAASLASLAPGVIASYTVAGLPVVTSANHGLVAYASNGRANAGQGAGLGRGCICSVDSTGTWCAIWSGTQVVA